MCKIYISTSKICWSKVWIPNSKNTNKCKNPDFLISSTFFFLSFSVEEREINLCLISSIYKIRMVILFLFCSPQLGADQFLNFFSWNARTRTDTLLNILHLWWKMKSINSQVQGSWQGFSRDTENILTLLFTSEPKRHVVPW